MKKWKVPAAVVSLLGLGLTLGAIHSAHAQPNLIPIRKIEASSVWKPQHSAASAIDGNSSTAWISGAVAPQAVQLDLGALHDLSRVRLLVKQDLDGATKHLISFGDTRETAVAGTLEGHTRNGQRLEFNTQAKGVRYIHILTEKSPSWVAWAEIQVEGVRSAYQPGVTPPAEIALPPRFDSKCPGVDRERLKYFGYFGSAFSGVQGDNYTAEISDHSNVTWISSGSADPTNDVEKLKVARDLGMKAVLYTPGVFFDARFHMHSDYRAKWENYAKAVKPYAGTIAAIFPMDEPYWNGKNHGISLAQMHAWYSIAASAIKLHFPKTPVGLIEAAPMINGSLLIPVDVDWVGFDCYGSWDSCQGRSIPSYLNDIKAKMLPHQKMILIADGTLHNQVPSRSSELPLLDRVNRYYDWALKDPSVVAIFPFIWQNLHEGGIFYGTREMSLVKARYREIGKCISGRSF